MMSSAEPCGESCAGPGARPGVGQAHRHLPLRHALGRYPTGVAIVTTVAADGRPVGLTINSFASLSLEPPLVLWSLSGRSPSLPAFLDGDRFAINVLARSQQALAKRFADRSVPDKFEGVGWAARPSEPPLLAGTAAGFVCRLDRTLAGGDHLLLIGEIEHWSLGDEEPLVFCAGRFGDWRVAG